MRQLPAQPLYVRELVLLLLDHRLAWALSLTLLLLQRYPRLFSLALFVAALPCPYLNVAGLLALAGFLAVLLVCLLSSTNVTPLLPFFASYPLYLSPV
ncbi:hypothetical protein HBI12_240870 [Parastagonospora nodorum]|nr:hypothetical protein HBI12_240870 [Parastagonospora nodorum]KAH5395106.1 hypothetical protein HBI47_235360 [Parastagonospora nodorum]